MNMGEVTCNRCRNEVCIEGDAPKVFAYCDTCHDYVDFDVGNYLGSLIDAAYDNWRDNETK